MVADVAVTPKPPVFNADAFDNALDTRVRNGPSRVTVGTETYVVTEAATHYSVIQQFRGWKVWVDALRNHIEALRLGVFGEDGVKAHVDRLDAREQLRHVNVDSRLDALEAAHRPLGSGSG